MKQPSRVLAAARTGLLAFVLVTLGFILGKESGLRAGRSAEGGAGATGPPGVAVTYAHTTFRCATCNTIERLAHEVLTTRFARELESGLVTWQTVNFQEDEAFARRHKIVSSTVVLNVRREGRELDSRRLDEVWTLVNDEPAFKRTLTEAVEAALARLEGSG